MQEQRTSALCRMQCGHICSAGLGISEKTFHFFYDNPPHWKQECWLGHPTQNGFPAHQLRSVIEGGGLVPAPGQRQVPVPVLVPVGGWGRSLTAECQWEWPCPVLRLLPKEEHRQRSMMHSISIGYGRVIRQRIVGLEVLGSVFFEELCSNWKINQFWVKNTIWRNSSTLLDFRPQKQGGGAGGGRGEGGYCCLFNIL